ENRTQRMRRFRQKLALTANPLDPKAEEKYTGSTVGNVQRPSLVFFLQLVVRISSDHPQSLQTTIHSRNNLRRILERLGYSLPVSTPSTRSRFIIIDSQKEQKSSTAAESKNSQL